MEISLEAVCGYRIDEGVPRGWRLALKALFIVSVVAVAVAMIVVTHRDPTPRRGNIQILSTLDEFTRDAGPDATNTIPEFLELPGETGVLGPSSDSGEAVRALNIADLREGFCSPSVVRQIRHQYPGFYDSWPDEKLRRLALEKYPELRDRQCTLSYKIDATPVGVIKYRLNPRTLAEHSGLWLVIVLVTGAFALGCVNLYYRVLVDRIGTAVPIPRPSWNPEV